MKRLMTFAAAGTAALLNAETLTVEKGQSVSVTSAVTYDAVTVHGDLTVSGAWLAIPDGTGVNGEEKVVVSLGPDAGDAATLTVKDDGEFGQTSNVGKGEILEVGANGGWGRVDVQSKKKTFAFRLRYFDIADAATPPAEDPTVLTVGGTVNLRSLRNKSSKAVKVTFAGGAVWAKDSNGYIWFENTLAPSSWRAARIRRFGWTTTASRIASCRMAAPCGRRATAILWRQGRSRPGLSCRRRMSSGAMPAISCCRRTSRCRATGLCPSARTRER